MRCQQLGLQAAERQDLGAKIAENATLEEWKDRPAQVEVPRADLVAAVRKMLAP